MVACACLLLTACGEFGVAADAASDAGGDAGGVSMDGSVDAPGNAGTCAVKLCSTFDPPFDVKPYQWNAIVGDPSNLTLASPGLLSANALRVESPTSVVYLSKDAGLAKRISIRLSLRVDALPPDKNPSRLLELVCSNGGAFNVLRVFNDGTLDFTDGTGQATSVSKVVLQTWLAVEVDVAAGAKGWTSTVKTPSDGQQGAGTATACDGTVEIRVGDMRESASSAVLLFDDIQADWGP